MRINLIILAIAVTLTACDSTSKQFKGEEFEGVVTYKLDYENFTDTSFKSSYGDTMRAYYQHGKLLQVYTPTAKGGLKEGLMDLHKNEAYIGLKGTDTLQYYTPKGKNMLPGYKSTLTTFETGDTSLTYAGHACKKIKTIFLHEGKGIRFLEYRTFVYAPNVIAMNSKWFKDFEYFALNRTMAESNAYYIYFEDHYEHLGTMKYRAVDIKKEKLDSAIFKIDQNKLKPFTTAP